MEIFTRKMRIEDAQFINNLSAQMGYELTLPETMHNVRQIIGSKDDCAFVAIAEEKIIGWVHAFKAIRIESNPFIEIGGIVVDKAYRGNGAGKILVNTIMEWGIAEKCNTLRVRCNTQRVEAHKFYSKIGFRETKEQKIFQLEI